MEQFTQQERSLISLFRMSRDAVCLVKGGTVIHANAAAARLFGRSPEGERLERLLPELPTELEEDCVTAAQFGGVTHTVTAVCQGDVRIITVPVQEKGAAVPAAALTALRSAAFRLRVSIDRLAADKKDDPYTDILYHSYYSLLQRIGQLADCSALQRGDMACRMQTLDLAALVRELTESVAFFAAERKAEIRCRVPEEVCPVRGDAEKLQQLLLILLSNSLLHTPEGGHITVGLTRSGRQYILSVDDDGAGIAPEDMAYAFTVRDDDQPDSALSGAGMGLYIAHALARLHGGTVVLQSREGSGTRVRLTLPAEENLSLRDSEPFRSRGPELILTELADVLPSGAYKAKYRE